VRPRPIVTIDGPAGCGKSTAAAALARTLGYLYLDTGAMYRALALKSLSRGIAATDARQLGRLARRTDVALRGDRRQILRVWLDGADVTRAIRTATVAARASEIAAIPAVRRAMVAQQRRLGRTQGDRQPRRRTRRPDPDVAIVLDDEARIPIHVAHVEGFLAG